MDVREKLVKLLSEIIDGGFKWHNYLYESGEQLNNDDIASYLIAHGVTVQECGEWVYDHWCEFKCSVCGEFSNSKPYKGKENYCPNCGSKMVPQQSKGE